MLYTGVTQDLERRVWQHKNKVTDSFTSKYRVTRLVYYEATSSVYAAIAREKQIKGWVRSKKRTLIESMNPRWLDQSVDWGKEADSPVGRGDSPARNACGRGSRHQAGFQ